MPPKKSAGAATDKTGRTANDKTTTKKRKQVGQTICDICNVAITEGTDEALECDGCKKWVHRYCAGVSLTYFQVLADSSKPFFCTCCSDANNMAVVSELRKEVTALKAEVANLKSALDSVISSPTHPGYNAVTLPSDCLNDKNDTGETINISSHKRLSPCLTELNTENIAPFSSSQKYDTEKKFNLVLYGVEECRPGMSKSARLEADLKSVISIFSHIDSSIQAQSIKDCFRLGKYIPSQSRSRPILVKFIRFTDVTKVLSSRAKISRPFFVKPDMSLEERAEESLLMKERWGLIQSGIERKK